MTDRLSRRRVLLGAGAATLGALGGCVTVSGNERSERADVSRTFDADGLEEATIENDVGEVTVTAEDGAEVRVEATKRASTEDGLEDVELAADRTDGTLALRVDRSGDGRWFGAKPSMDLTVAVPASLRVAAIETDTGDVDVEGVAGPLEATTDTGAVAVADVDSVTASTNTGEVTVRNAGSATVSTNTGDVTLRNASLERVETDTGDVDAEVASLADDPGIETNTGDVDAALAPSLDARLSVDTDTGDVTVGGLDLRDAEQRENRLEGTLGDGTHQLRIETNTGDVSLSALE